MANKCVLAECRLAMPKSPPGRDRSPSGPPSHPRFAGARTGLKPSPVWGKLWDMSTIAEIETAIEQLSPQEQQQLREWLLERGQPQGSTEPVGRKLLALSGAIKSWPRDFAENHDHYLHGAPKRKAP
jgi:hypothetical protein